MKKIITILLLLLCSVFSFAQRKVVGVVSVIHSNGAKKPAPRGTTVFIPGVASATTDFKGYYSINLAQCKVCKTGETVKVYVNSDAGSTSRKYVIPRNPSLNPFDIELRENNKFILTGAVKDKKTGKHLEGIEVNVIIQNYGLNIPTVTTNRNGYFKVIIRKENISNTQAITLFLSDADKSKYADLEKIVFLNQYGPVHLEMDECANCGARHKLKINTFVKTKILVEEGDLVTIKADGVIRVGSFVGTSGPEGVANNRGVLGMSLEQYNFFKTWNHAVLVYRFGEDDEWKFYDNQKENKYLAQETGYLELGVNDNNVNDNSGSYNVEVVIRR